MSRRVKIRSDRHVATRHVKRFAVQAPLRVIGLELASN
jgi:hypothetical protein